MTQPASVATERPDVELRPLSLATVDEYFDLVDANRAHLTAHGDYEFEGRASRDEIHEYFLNPPDHNIRFGVYLNERLVGRVDLNPVAPPHYVLGYWLDRNAIGQGIATVACRALIYYAISVLGATDIFAGVTHGNSPSIAVLDRLGFLEVARFDTYTRYQLGLTLNDDAPGP